MTELISTSTIKQGVPQLNHSSIILKTPGSAATGDTIDVSAYFDEIYTVYFNDDAGAVVICSWVAATRVITLGTITTGIHMLHITGIKN